VRGRSRYAAADVPRRDRHDEPEVRLGQLPLGEVTVAADREEVGALFLADDLVAVETFVRVYAGFDALRERDLLFRGEEGDLPDLLEVHAHRVEAAALAR